MINLLSTNSLIGTGVQNPQGEELGQIEEVMIDLGTGRVTCALLAYSGTKGSDEKFLVVPWEALRVDSDAGRVMIDFDREHLSHVPGLERDAWRQMDEADWQERAQLFYGRDGS